MGRTAMGSASLRRLLAVGGAAAVAAACGSTGGDGALGFPDGGIPIGIVGGGPGGGRYGASDGGGDSSRSTEGGSDSGDGDGDQIGGHDGGVVDARGAGNEGGVQDAGMGGDDAEPGDSGASIAINLPGGFTSLDWTIDGPHVYSGTVHLGDAQSIEFVAGGLAEGAGYTVTLRGTDRAGDACSGTSPPFAVSAGAVSFVALEITCTMATDATAPADVTTGGVEVDATIAPVDP
jgi:hypothetical protein